MLLKLATSLIKLNETLGDNLIPSRNQQTYSAVQTFNNLHPRWRSKRIRIRKRKGSRKREKKEIKKKRAKLNKEKKG